MIHITCPHCGKQFRAPDRYIGRKVQCKSCSAAFRIPEDELPVATALPGASGAGMEAPIPPLDSSPAPARAVASYAGGEPKLPIEFQTVRSVQLGSHRDQFTVHVNETAMAFKGKNTGAKIELPRQIAARCVELPKSMRLANMLRVWLSEGGITNMRLRVGKEFSINRSRLRCWLEGVSGNEALRMIRDEVTRSLCIIMVWITSALLAFNLAFLLISLAMPKPIFPLWTIGGGAVILAAALVGMFLRQVWAPLLAGILTAINLIDAAIFLVWYHNQLVAAGWVFLIFRVLLFGSLTGFYFQAFGGMLRARRFRPSRPAARPEPGRVRTVPSAAPAASVMPAAKPRQTVDTGDAAAALDELSNPQ